MVSGKHTIQSETGLHLRPASDLCYLAMKYSCKIEIKTNNTTINAKSLLGILSAGIKYQDVIEFICDGEQEQEALTAILELLESNFALYQTK